MLEDIKLPDNWGKNVDWLAVTHLVDYPMMYKMASVLVRHGHPHAEAVALLAIWNVQLQESLPFSYVSIEPVTLVDRPEAQGLTRDAFWSRCSWTRSVSVKDYLDFMAGLLGRLRDDERMDLFSYPGHMHVEEVNGRLPEEVL